MSISINAHGKIIYKTYLRPVVIHIIYLFGCTGRYFIVKNIPIYLKQQIIYFWVSWNQYSKKGSNWFLLNSTFIEYKFVEILQCISLFLIFFFFLTKIVIQYWKQYFHVGYIYVSEFFIDYELENIACISNGIF